MLRRRQLVFTSMADAMTDDIGQWLNRIKSAGTDQLNNILAVLRTHVNSLGTHRCTMGDTHDELSELHQAFIDSQVEVLPMSVTRTNSMDRFVTDLDRYIVALNNRADKRDSLIARGNYYTTLLDTDEADRAPTYDAQIKEAERQLTMRKPF